MKDTKVVVGFAMANTVKEQQATAWFFVFEDKKTRAGLLQKHK